MKVTVSHLTKRFGELTVFSDVSFAGQTGECLCICGESGKGKTTLLRCLAGLESVDAGTIALDERILSTADRPMDRQIAMAFQEPALWNHKTVRENLTFVRDKKKSYRYSLEEIADDLEIGDLLSRYPAKISGGQAKRVALARALAAEKAVLLLDEPLANVDPERKARILARLKEKYFPQAFVLYVTHDAWEAERIGGKKLDI